MDRNDMDTLRAIFNRRVRAGLYLVALALVPSFVAAGDLPAWALPLAGPPLLALLNLSPGDVEDDDNG